MSTIKKRWVSTDAWRGYYVPVAPEGFELLADCSVVKESGQQCRDILASWLKKNKIRYRSGYLRTSNVFSAHMYIIIESGKIDEATRRRIDDWFCDQVTSTFSIFSGTSWDLDVAEAQSRFDAAVAGLEVAV